MVHHIMLFKLKPEVTTAKVEKMMMTTRMMLLKIPEILSVKCGKTIREDNAWPFFIALDFESLDKQSVAEDDPVYLKFVTQVVKPHVAERLSLLYEMEPGKSVKFS